MVKAKERWPITALQKYPFGRANKKINVGGHEFVLYLFRI